LGFIATMSETATQERTDYTEGSITASILKMGVPSMLGFISQHVYTMTDMFWVSQLPNGQVAVAAITFFNNLAWLLFSFNSLVGPGSVAVISRRYGEKEYDLTEKAIKETILLKLLFGGALGLIGLLVLPQALRMLGANGDALSMGTSYGRIWLFGLPITYATYSIFTALRGTANPHASMVLMISAALLNVALDPVFIFGYLGMPALGIDGAAYASVLSFVVAFGTGLVLFGTGRTNVRLHLFGKEPLSSVTMWQILRIGIPAWLAELSFAASRMLITPMVAAYGTAVVAAYGVGMQVFGFGITLLVGMGLGLSSLIGHNVGSGKLDRAKKTADRSILFGVSIMVVIGAVTAVFAHECMDLFFEEPETIRYGVELLRIWALSLPFFGAFIMLEQIHSGVGLTTPSMVIVSLHSWGLQLLPAFVCTQLLGFGVAAVWWSLSLSGVVSSTIFYLYYRRGRWLTVKL
jgi:putative MATE family efflux protein